MSEIREKAAPEKPQLNREQLVARILSDMKQLVHSGWLRIPYDSPLIEFLSRLLRGDPPPDSATLTFIPGTSLVDVKVTLPTSSGRTLLAVTASQNNTSTELATASSAPASNELGAQYTYSNNYSLVVKLEYRDAGVLRCKLAEFTQPQMSAATDTNLAMYNCP